ncbi:MAG: FtsX-like permease family protein [Planctomycetota bacterium]
MAFFPHQNAARLVRVRAIRGGYPFYGALVTEPAAAAARFRDLCRSGASDQGALVDQSLLLELNAAVGDHVRVGKTEYAILGALMRAPGESTSSALFGPRVYVPLATIDPVLLARGSHADYDVFFELPAPVDVARLEKRFQERLEALDLRTTTVASREESWGDALMKLQGFLALTGFVALLLGGLGVGSAMHAYAHEKADTTAVLRCLGTPARTTLAIYVTQAIVLGAAASLVGCLLGLLVQEFLPRLLQGLLPFPITPHLEWAPLLLAGATGVVVAVLFALLPLVALRNVPPLAALRSSYEISGPRFDPARLVIATAILLGTGAFAWWQSHEVRLAIAFPLGLALIALVLAALARGSMWVLRRISIRHFPYVWRQGLLNLGRPRNHTILLTVTLGLSACMVLTVDLTRHLLLAQIEMAGGAGQANVVLFDIQDDQRMEVARLVESLGFELFAQVPVVTMRITSVKGRTVAELRKDRQSRIPTWTLTREYRSTYRPALIDTERLVAGKWIAAVADASARVPISLEQEIAGRLGVTIGDELEFDVQGTAIKTTVTSLRQVDWRRVQPNFFVVFPTGALESAPKFHAIVTRSESAARTAQLERALIAAFPGVSTIDVSQILVAANAILDRVAFAIRFMALFSMVAGVLVLTSAVWVSRAQRREESALLRSLGATRAQVQRMAMTEHFLLGLVSALGGVALALLATWALAALVLEVPFTVSIPAPFLTLVMVSGVTFAVASLAGRGVHRAPPLRVLGAET